MAGSMDGFALARWIRGNRPDMKVMLASGDAKKADAAKELCEKATYLKNPTTLKP